MFRKTKLYHSLPLSLPNLRDFHFEVDRNFENSFVIASPYFFQWYCPQILTNSIYYKKYTPKSFII